MGSFALDLQRFADKCKERADDAVGNIIVRIAAEVDKRSPVGNPDAWSEEFKAVATELGWIGPGYIGGHFRANWQLGVGAMPMGEIPGVDRTGEKTQGRIIAEIPDQAAGKVYYIANNVPYAQRLEYGYSKQAPSGIVGLTVTMFQDIVREAVEALT